MSQQNTNTIMMVRPVQFRFNEQTAVNNYYQKVIEGLSADQIQTQAQQEFDGFVEKLEKSGVNVIVIDDTISPDTPDSIFPNNWVSFHGDGRVGLYPMCAINRRLERRMEIFDILKNEHHLEISAIEDFTHHENEDLFLEGTGSMILDRVHMIAYAAISVRTNLEIFEEFCDKFDFQAVTFVANQTVDGKRLPIYHTNVMMCVADQFAVVCLDTIDDVNERSNLIEVLEDSDREIIEISEDQVNQFAGNMLQVVSDSGQKYLVMSSSAYNSLDSDQINTIENYCPIIHSSLDTIEALGGGSARCMMAEVFLPKKAL